MTRTVLLSLLLATTGCADVSHRHHAARVGTTEKALEEEIALLQQEERILTNSLRKLEYELGPADAVKLRVARDRAYPPSQRLHDLATIKAVLSRRVEALNKQRKLYWDIASAPY